MRVGCRHDFGANRTQLGDAGMSAWLIAVVGLVYAGIGVMQALKGNTSMAVVFTGYAFSNIGLYLLAK